MAGNEVLDGCSWTMWRNFPIPKSLLCLDTVLAAGQSFRWRKNNSGEWVGVMADLVWKLKQTDERIFYQVYGLKSLSNDVVNFDAEYQQTGNCKGQHDVNFKDISTDAIAMATFASSQMKSELKLPESCRYFSNGYTKPAIKTECNQESMVFGTFKCDRLQKVGPGLVKCELHDEELNIFKPIKLSNEGTELIKQEALQLEEIQKDELPAQERYTQGPRRSKRIIQQTGTMNEEEQNKNRDGDLIFVKSPIEKTSSKGKRKIKAQGSKVTNDDSEMTHDPSNNIKGVDKTGSDPLQQLLEDYFQTSIDLDHLYTHWASKDPHFKQVGKHFQGVRLLRLDPTECLLSFVCSSNNHISRISSMVQKLCTNYGGFIASVDGLDYYTFPRLSDLCGQGVEEHLRELGFGYRAKFIASIARHVTQEKGGEWLDGLRSKPYPQARAELMTLLGVGAKVADCVCLMSLDKPEALPVDTHVWQFTSRNYMPKLHSAKSLTEKLYMEIGDFYRKLWGSHAGWAQAVLFAADLKHNKDRSDGKEDSSNKRKMTDDSGSQKPQMRKTK